MTKNYKTNKLICANLKQQFIVYHMIGATIRKVLGILRWLYLIYLTSLRLIENDSFTSSVVSTQLLETIVNLNDNDLISNLPISQFGTGSRAKSDAHKISKANKDKNPTR